MNKFSTITITWVFLIVISLTSCTGDFRPLPSMAVVDTTTPASSESLTFSTPMMTTSNKSEGDTKTQASPQSLVTKELGVTTPTPWSIQANLLRRWSFPGHILFDDLDWLPQSDKFIMVALDEVGLYDVNTYQKLWIIPPIAPVYNASGVAILPDGKSFVLYNDLLGLQVREILTGELLAEKQRDIMNPGDCFPSTAVDSAISMDGQNWYITISREDQQQKSHVFSEIHVWDTYSLECVGILDVIDGDGRSLDISSDGRFLALGTGLNTSIADNEIEEDGLILVRELEIGDRVCLIDTQGSIARFKPDSSLLLVTDPKNERLVYWNVETCQEFGELPGITTRYQMTFSHDGRWVALWNKGIWIVGADSGNILVKISDPVTKDVSPIQHLIYKILSFSPDGQYIIYSSRLHPTESLIFLWIIEEK